MYRLTLIAEFARASTRDEALAQLDGFREAVQPSHEHGVALLLALPSVAWFCDECGHAHEARP